MDANTPERYCSTIQLELVVDNKSYNLSKVQADRIYLRKPTYFPRCHGEVIVYVDGLPRVWKVQLPHGAVPFDEEVPIVIQS